MNKTQVSRMLRDICNILFSHPFQNINIGTIKYTIIGNRSDKRSS